MSFINLMANDIWTDADITRRTEAMIRTEFSEVAETILNRKILGMSMGTYTPTPEDQADLQRYSAVAQAAQAEGIAARSDMALLLKVMAMEQAQARLNEPPLPEDATEEQIAQDAAERLAAEAVLVNAGPEAQALFLLRNPEPVTPDVPLIPDTPVDPETLPTEGDNV